MRLRELGWATCLVGLPLSHVLLGAKIDLWHSQTLWMQGWVGVLWAAAWTQGLSLPRLRAVGLWMGWTAAMTLWAWHRVVVGEKVYPALMLMPLTHVVVILAFLQAALTSWTPSFVERLLRGLAWMTGALIVYGLLQLANLDQFFRNLDLATPHDLLVGSIGNPTHFAIQLAILLPCLLLQRGIGWRVATGGLLGMVVLCQSAMGLLACWVVLTCWLAFQRNRWWLASLLLGLAGLGLAALRFDYLNPEGRWAAWSVFWTWFAAKAITGHGLGFVMEASRRVIEPMSAIFQWRHVHNEWFQLAIEQGVVGVGLVALILGEWSQRIRHVKPTPLLRACVLMVLACVLASLTSFPWHLWAVGGYGLVGFCGALVVAGETTWP